MKRRSERNLTAGGKRSEEKNGNIPQVGVKSKQITRFTANIHTKEVRKVPPSKGGFLSTVGGCRTRKAGMFIHTTALKNNKARKKGEIPYKIAA